MPSAARPVRDTIPEMASVNEARPAARGYADAVALPLDVVRAGVLRLLGRPGRVLLSDRSARVATYAAVGLLASLLLASFAPVWTFALGPIILGVPHLLADVRYLVVRPGLHRRTALAVSVAAPLVIGTFEQSAAIGLSAGLGAIAFARASLRRKGVLLAAWVLVVLAAAKHDYEALLVVVHLHNFVAVALFVAAFARSRRVGIAAAIASIAMSAALVGGALDDVLFRFTARATGPATAADLACMMDTLAPVTDPILALRLTTLFVFMQGVHYVLWLRVIPDEARERPGIRSFASSIRALERDLGKGLLLLFALGTLAVAARATTSLEAARLLYLRGASFHAWLEIAFALLLVAEGRAALLRNPR